MTTKNELLAKIDTQLRDLSDYKSKKARESGKYANDYHHLGRLYMKLRKAITVTQDTPVTKYYTPTIRTHALRIVNGEFAVSFYLGVAARQSTVALVEGTITCVDSHMAPIAVAIPKESVG